MDEFVKELLKEIKEEQTKTNSELAKTNEKITKILVAHENTKVHTKVNSYFITAIVIGLISVAFKSFGG